MDPCKKTGEISYLNRQLQLKLLSLVYDREIKDLIFFFKSVNNCTFISLNELIFPLLKMVPHVSAFLLRPASSTPLFYCNVLGLLVKLWNLIVIDTPPTNFISSLSFKRFLQSKYKKLLISTFDVNCTHSWTQGPRSNFEIGGGMTEYWGGTVYFFLLTLYNFKNIGGGGARAPPALPTPRSLGHYLLISPDC